MLRPCCASLLFLYIPEHSQPEAQMSVRKRTWKTESGEIRSAYVVQYSTSELDMRGKRKRHIQTFERKKDADAFHAQTRVDIGKGENIPASKSITVEKA